MMINLPPKAHVASFDIDAQNTFTHLCPDELPVPGGVEIVPELNAMARFASVRAGSKDAHSDAAVWVATPEQPQLTPITDAGPNVDKRWKGHGRPGTFGFDLIKGLPAPSEYSYFVWKGVELDMHPYGACYHDLANRLSTGVIEFFRVGGIKTVLLGGLAAEYCYKLTGLQLLAAAFDVVVVQSATRGFSPETVAEAFKELEAAGARFVPSTAYLMQGA